MIPGLVEGLATGGADLLSGGIGIGHANYSAAKQRHFIRSMDNTKFQRAARDLESAGLNRILALGHPGSTGSPSAPTVSGPEFGATASRLANTASAKQSVEQSKAQESMVREQENLIRDQQDATKAQAEQARAKARLDNAVAKRTEVVNMPIDKVGPAAEELVDDILPGIVSSAKGARELLQSVPRITPDDVKEGLNKLRRFYEEKRDTIRQYWRKK